MSVRLTPEMVAAKFWTHIERIPFSECWYWTADINWKGYGRFYVGGRKYVGAHRYSYERHIGPIPQGMTLDHLCRTRSCVRPDHLQAVTNRENVLRGLGTSAENARKTHCKYGHPLSGDNVRWYGSDGAKKRACKACGRRKYLAKQTALEVK